MNTSVLLLSSGSERLDKSCLALCLAPITSMPQADSKTYREYEVLIKDRMWLLMWAPGRRSDYYYAKIKVGIKKYA